MPSSSPPPPPPSPSPDRSTAAAYVRALTRAEDLTYRLPRDSISAAHPSRPGIVGRAPSPAASERANEQQQQQQQYAYRRCRADGRARVLDRLRPLIGFRPRPYKIAKRPERRRRSRRRRATTTATGTRDRVCVRRRRRWRQRRPSPFPCVRENSRDRRPTTRVTAKSGRFISVNAHSRKAEEHGGRR